MSWQLDSQGASFRHPRFAHAVKVNVPTEPEKPLQLTDEGTLVCCVYYFSNLADFFFQLTERHQRRVVYQNVRV
jgi:hypothetical protein